MGKTKLTDEQRVTAADAVSRLIGSKGSVAEGELKNCIVSSLRLGTFPRSDYGKILFTARVKKVEGKYYLMGTGPDKPKEEAKPKKKAADTSTLNGQKIHEFEDVEVTVKRKGLSMTVVAKFVRIVLPVVILLAGVHFLGFI